MQNRGTNERRGTGAAVELSILIEGRKRLSDQLYQGIRRAILDGRLGAGDRVPATRELAQQYNLSRNTVLTAYDRLISEGYLRSSVGSGTYVERHFPNDEKSASQTAPQSAAHLSNFARRLSAPQAIVPRRDLPFDLRPGVPELRHFPMEKWRRIAGRQSRRFSASTAYYGDAAGDASLRVAIARHFSHTRALSCSPSDAIVVSGSQQALDIIARILIEPGDVAAVEDPGYPAAIAAFRALGARIVPVPVDGEGICTDRLPKAAKVVYVTPSHQFPLGVPLSLSRRRTLIEWAARTGAIIIEDDYDSEFRYGTRPLEALQGLDRAGCVIYLGTFSKVLFPSLRLGFVVPPSNLYSAFLSAKWLTDRHTQTIEQHVLAAFMAEGHFARYLRHMQTVYFERQTILLESIERWLSVLRPVPAHAGLHLAGFMPNDFPVNEFITRAAASGVGLYSISPFYQRNPRQGLIFGFGSCSPADISEGIRRAGNIWKAMKFPIEQG